eukprot:9395156-Alexandrium_andersonii.AAC.1
MTEHMWTCVCAACSGDMPTCVMSDGITSEGVGRELSLTSKDQLGHVPAGSQGVGWWQGIRDG